MNETGEFLEYKVKVSLWSRIKWRLRLLKARLLLKWYKYQVRVCIRRGKDNPELLRIYHAAYGSLRYYECNVRELYGKKI